MFWLFVVFVVTIPICYWWDTHSVSPEKQQKQQADAQAIYELRRQYDEKQLAQANYYIVDSNNGGYHDSGSWDGLNFTARCNQMIEWGWQPQGGIVIQQQPSWSDKADVYKQTFVRVKPITAESELAVALDYAKKGLKIIDQQYKTDLVDNKDQARQQLNWRANLWFEYMLDNLATEDIVHLVRYALCRLNLPMSPEHMPAHDRFHSQCNQYIWDNKDYLKKVISKFDTLD